MEEKLPSFSGFLRVVNKQYKIDKYIAKMTQKYEVIQMKWIRYKELFWPITVAIDNLLFVFLIITIHT